MPPVMPPCKLYSLSKAYLNCFFIVVPSSTSNCPGLCCFLDRLLCPLFLSSYFRHLHAAGHSPNHYHLHFLTKCWEKHKFLIILVNTIAYLFLRMNCVSLSLFLLPGIMTFLKLLSTVFYFWLFVLVFVNYKLLFMKNTTAHLLLLKSIQPQSEC